MERRVLRPGLLLRALQLRRLLWETGKILKSFLSKEDAQGPSNTKLFVFTTFMVCQ